MADIRLENVSKSFGSVEAVKDLSLTINHQEFLCILGPPGAGKTTTLRLIVGLENPDKGSILIGGERVNGIYPGDRDIAMIFQNLALYPNRTVYENIAFPLRERNLPGEQIELLVKSTAEMLHIERLLDRKPAKLSGGERQRVAIGRALVRQPRAYLMDEPLANLDALLRSEMRVELKRLQREMGQTLVYVTHDQIEALSMADRIAILDRGVLQQCDTPDTIYNLPANRYVATVVGSPPMNFWTVELKSNGDDTLHLVGPGFGYLVEGRDHALRDALAQQPDIEDKVLLGFRPEDVTIFQERPSDGAFIAEVLVTEPLGAETIVDLALGPCMIKAVVPPTYHLSEREQVWVMFNPAKLHVFNGMTGARIYSSTTSDPLIPSLDFEGEAPSGSLL